MTEKLLATIAQSLKTMQNTQVDQGKDIKELTKAFAAQAVHNEQLRSTQAQVTKLWEKFDDYCGPSGIMTQIKDHQAHCPKDEIDGVKRDADKSYKQLWVALGLLATLVVGLAAKGHL